MQKRKAGSLAFYHAFYSPLSPSLGPSPPLTHRGLPAPQPSLSLVQGPYRDSILLLPTLPIPFPLSFKFSYKPYIL